MLSKKMAFSLMSLITIFALAFGVAPAMAQDFDAGFSVTDVSFAGDDQIEHAAEGAVVVNIKFGEVVSLADVRTALGASATDAADATKHAAATSTVDIFNKFGALLDTATNTIVVAARDLDPDTTNVRYDGKNFMITIAAVPFAADNDNTNPTSIRLFLAEGAVGDANPDSTKKSKKAGPYTVHLVGADPDPSLPMPVSIMLANNLLVPDAGFTGDSFDLVVTLSEQPKENKFPKGLLDIDAKKGAAADGVYLGAIDAIDGPDADTDVEAVTGRTSMHHQFLVKITPRNFDGDLVIKLKSFEDQNKPTPNMYTPPTDDLARMQGMNILTVKIKKASSAAKTEGIIFTLPKDKVIPGSGYLVVAEDKGGSAVTVPGGKIDESPKAADRTPAQLKYNVIDDGDLPNLETFLANGGTIDVVSPHALVISEIMWGSDASIVDDSSKSQWIELSNAGAEYKTKEDDVLTTADEATRLVFYGPNETPPAANADGTLPAGVTDRVGTVGAGGFWAIAGKGQSGRSGVGEEAGQLAAVVPTQAIVSMQRVIAAGVAADGTMASSWAASVPPSVNFDANKVGIRTATPGAAPVAYPVAPTPEPPAVTVPVAMASDIVITEVMVDTANGRLPQWIELNNVSGAEKSLAGWSLMIQNSDADADVVGASVSINLSGTLGVGGGVGAGGTMGKSLLIVAWGARSSSNLSTLGDRLIDASSQTGETGRYKLISDMAFMIALIPPQTTGVLTYGDAAGNLGAAEAWEIPMDETGRSSLIRREMDAGMATMGTDANGWVLASSTGLVDTPATWYGSDEDAGTPGVVGGGPLPVELSHFRPARDKATGQVVITWATQSELNNAGFFIKRSQQRDGEFKVINATMIAGAGTTSEKQFYTFTDTTAQPNVVYYYQIEDVSLDGNRQTLTRGIRLKGHIGAAGKLTSTWGELKTSNE